jgi:membrane protein YdbS with pleckstrin-like domain
MTATMQEHSSTQSPSENWVSRILVPEMWATVAIVVMWMAVLFVGVYGGDMTFHGADSSWSTIPAGVAVALFAAIGTVSVAKRVFGRT